MLVHAHHAAPDRTLSAAASEPQSAGAGAPLWEGSPTGMAASTLALSPLTVQQNVPNIGEAQTAPKTKVNPTLEQGEGRSPGWRWAWMRKNIPFAPSTQEHGQRHFGHLRAEYPRGTGHPPGSGPGQTVAVKQTKHRPTVLAEPQTVYYTAAMPPSPTFGGEPT
jgi:hypothetical protein